MFLFIIKLFAWTNVYARTITKHLRLHSLITGLGETWEGHREPAVALDTLALLALAKPALVRLLVAPIGLALAVDGNGRNERSAEAGARNHTEEQTHADNDA